MTPKELKEEIKRRVSEAGKNQLWQKAGQLAEKFGVKSTRLKGFHTVTAYDLQFEELDIHKSYYIFSGESVVIRFHGNVVFEAAEANLKTKNLDKYRIILLPKKPGIARKGVEIKIYIPGEWENRLSYRKVSAYLRAKRAEEQRAEDEKILNEIDRKLKESEKELAKYFGITT